MSTYAPNFKSVPVVDHLSNSFNLIDAALWPRKFVPDFRSVPGVDHLGNSYTPINQAIWGRGFKPQPFRTAGITAPLVWGTFTLPDGYVAQSYLTQWFIENIDEPLVYSLLSGSLPTGLALSNVGSTAEGQISGTPTVAGSYTFTIRAVGPTAHADHTFTIIIHAATDTGSSFVGGL